MCVSEIVQLDVDLTRVPNVLDLVSAQIQLFDMHGIACLYFSLVHMTGFNGTAFAGSLTLSSLK